MITEDYVSFETAKLLKEKGFDEVCDCLYDNDEPGTPGLEINRDICCLNSSLDDNQYAAPTLQMATKWLRDVHKLYITISHRFSHNADQDVCFSYYVNVDEGQDGEFMTYEEACEAAIKYCLENLI